MPLNPKGKTIKRAMEKEERVFYASQNKGTIIGTHKSRALKNKIK